MRIMTAIFVGMTITLTAYGQAPATGSLITGQNVETVEWVKALSESQPEVRPLRPGDSVAEYCRMNSYRDSLLATRMFGTSTVDESPWIGGLNASEDSRKKLFKINVTGDELNVVNAGKPMSIHEAKGCQKAFAAKTKESDLDQADDLKANALQSAFFCKDLTLVHLGICAKAIPIMTKLMSPVSNISLRDTWKKLIYEPAYIRVLRTITLRNVDRVEKRKIPTIGFFEELKKEFYAITPDASTAEDMAFNVMGIISTDGPNTFRYLPCEYETLGETINVLTLTNAILDRMTATKGFVYTYPKEIPITCDYGKFYHFWMAAFLAREGVKLNHDIVASAAAAFSLNKGYQFMKTHDGRDPRNAFTEDVFSDYNNNMRLDMAQAAAGAWFGAISLQSPRKVLTEKEYNEALLLMFTGSKQTPRDPYFVMPTVKNPANLISAFSQWKKTMNPDAAYLYFESKLRP